MLTNEKILLIFLLVYIAMLANSFWESRVEGKNAGFKRKYGWRLKYKGKYIFSAYHFFLFIIMWPVLLSIPLVAFGWDTKLFGVLISAFFSGIIIEDFMWYVVNPEIKFSEFNSKFAPHYPWIKFGRIELPVLYVFSFLIAFLSWWFIWR